FADKLNETFALSPGKYSLFFTGTVSSNLAGYAGAMSAAPVPEPAEWMMILAGVAMMGVVVSRRRNNG
ncbi:MAG: FxDxF family PEP-CTERM protein, partial [Candidatus Methylophosphatis roskildensis]